MARNKANKLTDKTILNKTVLNNIKSPSPTPTHIDRIHYHQTLINLADAKRHHY